MHVMRRKLVGLVASLLVSLSQAAPGPSVTAEGGCYPVTSTVTSTMTTTKPTWSTTTVTTTVQLPPVTSTTTVQLPPVTSTTTVQLPPVTSTTTVQLPPVTSTTTVQLPPVTSTTTVQLPPVTSTTTVQLPPVTSTTTVQLPPVTSTSTTTVQLPPVTSTTTVQLPPVTSTTTTTRVSVTTTTVVPPPVTNTVTSTVVTATTIRTTITPPAVTNTVTSTVVTATTVRTTVTVPTTVQGPTITDTVTSTAVSVSATTVRTTIVSPSTVVSRTTVTQPTTVVSRVTVISSTTVSRTITNTATVTRTSTNVVTTCPTVALTRLVTCTSRIVNPTYTPPAPLPADHLWGCAPGTICTPPQVGCNWEQNPPADTYVCAPSECRPLPGLANITDYNSLWPNPTNATCAWYNPALGYFHLNPEHFGLTFAIFNVFGQPVCPTDQKPKSVGWVDWLKPKGGAPPKLSRRVTGPNPLAQILRRQSLAVAPAACYAVFDAASTVAENTGHVYNRLCLAGTPFQNAVTACRACAAANSGTSSQVDTFPDLQSYITWCTQNAP